MVTPEQAESMAQTSMQAYVMRCGCESQEEVANALMKLVSMCGLGMCAVVGQPDAVARLRGTTDYIEKAQAGKNWRKEPLQ